MNIDLLDEILLIEVFDDCSGDRAIDLQSINNRGDSDELHLGDIRLGLVVGSLVEEDSEICLFSDSGINLKGKLRLDGGKGREPSWSWHS